MLKTHQHIVGLLFFNQLGPTGDPAMTPYLTLTHRWKLADRVEVQTELGGQSILWFKRNSVDLTLSLVSGPRWQFHPFHAIQIRMGVLREHTALRHLLSLMTGVSYGWSLNNQWDLQVQTHLTVAEGLKSDLSPNMSFILKYLW